MAVLIKDGAGQRDDLLRRIRIHQGVARAQRLLPTGGSSTVASGQDCGQPQPGSE